MVKIQELIPVSEHHGIHRDAHSNSIINTDTDAYRSREAKRRASSELYAIKQQLKDLSAKYDALVFEIQELKRINTR